MLGPSACGFNDLYSHRGIILQNELQNREYDRKTSMSFNMGAYNHQNIQSSPALTS